MHLPIVVIPSGDHVQVLHHASSSYLKAAPELYSLIQAWLKQDAQVPDSFAVLVRSKWGLDVFGQPLRDVVVARPTPSTAYGLASWELNLLCNYNCPHCYLGERPNESMSLDDRLAIVDRMVEMGVVRLQLTGGEPLIDQYFVETYTAAYDRGIVLTISTNGLWLGKPSIVKLLQERPPLRVTVSLYGATAESYEAMTRTKPGTFNRYLKGLQTMVDAGVSLRVNTIVSSFNDHEIPQMEALAAGFSGDHHVYDTMSASILGSDEPLNLQAGGRGGMTRTDRPAFTGCGAGQESFHLDPLGRMSMCKASRETQVSLLGDERELSRLRLSAQLNLTRADGCTGCGIAAACTTCPVIVKNYRRAGAPGSFYCRSSSL